jgi:hypothetical protein
MALLAAVLLLAACARTATGAYPAIEPIDDLLAEADSAFSSTPP